MATPRVRHASEGPSLTEAILGSEGALGVITAVEGNKERLLLDRPALFLAYLVRPLPPFLSDRVSRMAGAFDLMTTFQGRAVGSDERARASA